jgi:hypothetical protein
MGLGSIFWLALVATTAINSPCVTAKKLRRVQAGFHYAEHDDVHIVVNKVGYVPWREAVDSTTVEQSVLSVICRMRSGYHPHVVVCMCVGS